MRLAILALAGCASAPGSIVRALPSPGDPGDTGSPTTDTDSPTDSGTDSDSGGDSGDTDSGTDTGTSPWAGDDDTLQPLDGIDVSHWQGDIDWARVAAQGYTFAQMKATDGTSYIDPTFAANAAGARAAGILHGGYHFAEPDESDGATQAEWFVANGGGWTPDGLSLPGMLDIEYASSGDTCYGLSRSEMANWVQDFDDAYIRLTGRAPLLYTNADWWNTCVGSSDRGSVNPLWVAYWGSSSSPPLPDDWNTYAVWQYGIGTADGVAGDVDVDLFPGTLHDLRTFALTP